MKVVQRALYEQVQKGAIVALSVPPEVFAKYKVDGPGAIPAEDAHVTLLYLGGEVPEQMLDGVRTALLGWSNIYSPFLASVGGILRFAASNAFALSIDSVPLGALRERIRLSFPWTRSEQAHGFVPHSTVKYLEPGEKLPYDSVSETTWQVTALELWRGDVHERFPLVGHFQEGVDALALSLLEGRALMRRRA